MTPKELQERINGLENKLDKMQNLEERLEKCFKNVEKFRDKMIQNGYSYQMLEEFNKAIQPITQHYNEIQNARKKLAMLQEEQKRMEQEVREKRNERVRSFGKYADQINLEPVKEDPVFPYHAKCKNFTWSEGEASCDVKMDLQYCGRNCPYATTEPCSNKVDGKGRTVAYKKGRTNNGLLRVLSDRR